MYHRKYMSFVFFLTLENVYEMYTGTWPRVSTHRISYFILYFTEIGESVLVYTTVSDLPGSESEQIFFLSEISKRKSSGSTFLNWKKIMIFPQFLIFIYISTKLRMLIHTLSWNLLDILIRRKCFLQQKNNNLLEIA